jgi:hypothetical protein
VHLLNTTDECHTIARLKYPTRCRTLGALLSSRAERRTNSQQRQDDDREAMVPHI